MSPSLRSGRASVRDALADTRLPATNWENDPHATMRPPRAVHTTPVTPRRNRKADATTAHGPRRRLPLVIGAALLSLAVLPPAPVAAAGMPVSWQITPSQDPSPLDNRLVSVACSTPDTCWAVGSYYNGTDYQTLAERSTPDGWVTVPTPDNSTSNTTNANQDNVLRSVTCLPGGPCFAAGYWYDGLNQAHPLVMENAGSGWQLMTTADSAPAVVDDFLSAITCTSATDCWAVGQTLVPGIYFVPYVPITGTPAQTLAEHWDGTQWKIVRTANTQFSENVLNGVACVSASECYAVGLANSGSGSYDTLVERWDGSAWSIVGSDNPSSTVNELDGAWCSAGGTCRATGIQRTPTATQMLAEQGGKSAAWASDSGAGTGPDRLNATTGIACTDDVDCWAVGEYDSNGSFLFQTLVTERTAAGWSVVPSADTSPAQSNQLWGVACADAASCYAVGWSTDAQGVNHTLIEQTQTPSVAVPELPTGAGTLAVGLTAAASGLWANRRRRHSAAAH